MADKAKSSRGSLIELVSGFSAGVIATTLLHPLDLVKVRLITAQTPYRHTHEAFAKIWRQNGLRGFYVGIAPNIIGNAVAWGSFFFFYDIIKKGIRGNGTERLGLKEHMLAASLGGVCVNLMTNPIWVIKTRMCMEPQATGAAVFKYRGVRHAFMQIARTEGLKGLYKGLIPGLFGVTHGGVQLMVYEELKRLRSKHTGVDENTKLSAVEYLVMAATSKTIAQAATYPYQVVRATIQKTDQVESVRSVITKVWRTGGIRNFYRGLVPSVIRVTPATCVTFLVYENMTHHLREIFNVPKQANS